MTVPYTYLLKHIPTGKFYYGCRFAEGCHPSEFWKTYKTSSKYVKQLVEEYGDESFVFEIRKVFSDKHSARNWETKVLTKLNVVKREDFLNRTDNISIAPEDAAKGRKGKSIRNSPEAIEKMRLSKIGKKASEETKRKMSESHKGRPAWNKGIPHSEETKQKMIQSRTGKKQPKSYSEKMKVAMTGRKLFINEHGQKKFCFPGTEPAGFAQK